MIEPRIFTLFRERVQEEISFLTQIVVDGSPKDYAEYRENCGHVRGLRNALDLLDEVVSKGDS